MTDRARRVEDPRILTGQGRYVDDVVLPGMLHASFVRSPLPHGLIRGIDVAEARRVPGVVAVLTAADLDGVVAPMSFDAPENLLAPAYPALAADKVRLVGDPVAIVLANSRAEAEDGCEAVDVDYEPLDPVVDAATAATESSALLFEELGTNVLHTHSEQYGDVEQAFAGAHRVVSATFRQHRFANVPMETRGGVADFDAVRGELEMYAAHQSPHGLRFHVARLLQLPLAQVHVQSGDIGGSFGQKGFIDRELVVIAAASRVVGRPVKWIEDRSENLMVGGHAREETLAVDAAVDADGVVRGLKIRMTLDPGAYPVVPFPVSMITTIVRVLFTGPYRILNYSFDARIVATNKASYVAYRGPWAAETWVRERLLDVIARDLGLEPLDVRRVNLYADADLPQHLASGPTLEHVAPRASLERAVELIDYDGFRKEQRAALEQGRHIGIGFASFVEPAPGPPDWGPAIGVPRPPQRAIVRLEADGGVSVVTSQSPHGQSHETTMAQVVAAELRVPIATVRVVFGNTRVTPFAMVGTGGSRAASLATGAAEGAARRVGEQAIALAASVLDAAPAALELCDGRVVLRDAPERGVALSELARLAWVTPALLPPGVEPGLEAFFDYRSPRGGWTQATHCCIAAVDVETGFIGVARYLVVEDCGRIINRAVVDGQIRGGVIQGLGGVLWERAAYGEDGQFIASTFMDYLLPTATESPEVEIEHFSGGHDDIARGVGEGGAIGAPAALTNAVEDALTPFGVRITEQHLPPGRVLELLGVVP